MNAKDLRRQEIASKIKNARIAANMTQAQVADKLGLTYQAISNYERGKNSIESDLLIKLCDIYKVNPMLILSDLYTCPVCGFTYDSSLQSDVDMHNEHHDLFMCAIERFGFCYSPDEWNAVKARAYDILNSDVSTADNKRDAAIELMKAYFSRSVSAHNFSLDHPSFDEYAAMLLNQKRFLHSFGGDIYNTLVRQYGVKPGIPEGETTWHINQPISSISNSAKTKEQVYTLSDEALQIAKTFDSLDDRGQGAVKAILNYEEASTIAEQRQMPTSKRLDLKIKKRRDGFVELKVYDQPAAAGLGNYLDDPAFHIEQYPADEVPIGTDFGIRISGDSMAPDIPDGSTAFIQSRSSIIPGKIGIFLLNGDAYCKKLVVDKEKNRIRLVSLNPTYSDRIIEECDDFHTMGSVLGYWNK